MSKLRRRRSIGRQKRLKNRKRLKTWLKLVDQNQRFQEQNQELLDQKQKLLDQKQKLLNQSQGSMDPNLGLLDQNLGLLDQSQGFDGKKEVQNPPLSVCDFLVQKYLRKSEKFLEVAQMFELKRSLLPEVITYGSQ